MEKIKHFIESDKGKDILIVIIIILVGLGSFGLGRLSKKPKNEGLRVEYTGETSNAIQAVQSAQNSQNSSQKAFFASSKGSKYYSVGCSAGKTIKQENRVYFDTREDAEGAGYELSSSCR
jgi:hypothetical protein